MAFTAFPPELLEMILAEDDTDFDDVVRATQVCRYWRNVILGPGVGGSSLLKRQVWLLDGHNPGSLHEVNGLLYRLLYAYGAPQHEYDKMCAAMSNWASPWVHTYAFHPMFSGFTLLTLYYYRYDAVTGKMHQCEWIVPGSRGIELVDVYESITRLLSPGDVRRVDILRKFKITTPEGEKEY